MVVLSGGSRAQQPVTAIDLALEPDATMIQHAKAANAGLLTNFPKGFALDETHNPHITLVQQFVRTTDLDKVYAAANAVLTREKPLGWTLKAFKYYYIPSSRSVLRASWSSRPRICTGCKMRSSPRSRPIQ